MVIEMHSEVYEIDSNVLKKWKFQTINKFGDTFYIVLKNNTTFSCHENFWLPFFREYKIDSVLNYYKKIKYRKYGKR